MELYELLIQLFQIIIAAITAYLVKRVDHSQNKQKKRLKHNNKNVKKFVSSILALFETGRETALEEEKSRSILYTTEQSFNRPSRNQEEQKKMSDPNLQRRVQRAKGAINSLREIKEQATAVDRDDDTDSCSSVENEATNPLRLGA